MKYLITVLFFVCTYANAGTVALYDESKKDIFIQTIEGIETDIKWSREGSVAILTEPNGPQSCVISNDLLAKIKIDKVSFMKLAMEPQTQVRCYLKEGSIMAKQIAIVINRNNK